MGQVIQFKRRESLEESPKANPLFQIGKDLQSVLEKHGVDYSNEKIRQDHLAIIYLVQAMLDRSLGKKSTNIVMLECIRESLGYMEDPINDDKFDDLLGHL